MTVDILQKEQSFKLPLLLEASAGTGKTFFISHFVIRSLLEGIELNQIAAITFTKKAASELKERIFSLIDEVICALVERDAKFGYLEPYLEDPDLYQKGLDRLIIAKGTLPQAIGTIHHFANVLLSDYSSKTITISPNLIEPFAKMTQEILEKTPPSPFLTSLLSLSQKQEKGWEKWIKALFERSPKETFANSMQFVQKRAEEIIQKAASFLPLLSRDSLDGGTLIGSWINQYKGAKALFEKRELFSRDLCRTLNGEIFLADLVDLYPELLELEEKKKKITPLANGSLQAFLDDDFLPYFFQITARGFVLDLFKEMIEPVWQPYRRKQQLVSFDDLLEEVNELIQTELFKERILSAYPLMIVDEFQDTDPLQWSILSQLYLGERNIGGLLLVGDPKQSIYGFRKADLHTYLDAANHSKLSVLTLTSNFRSAPILLKTLNLLFNSEHSQSWSWIPQKKRLIDVPILHARSTKVLPDHLGAAVEIGACLRLPSRERSFPGGTWEKQVAFPYIIQEIKKLQSCGISLREICILTVDRYQGFRLKEAFDEAGIPALVDRSVDVRENSELFALARLLFQTIHNPESKSKVLSLILSPLFQANPLQTTTLVVQAQSKLKLLSKLLIEERGLFFARLLKKPLFEGGRSLEEGISHLDTLLYEGATRGFWTLVEKLISSDPKTRGDGFESLLDEWQASLQPQDAWTIPKKEERDAVKMMTCFAAKGLEFDVVFALNLSSRSAIEKEDGEKEAIEKEEEIAERMRQLYVAMTRSKLKLYLLCALENPPQLHAFIPSPLELFFAQMLCGVITLNQAIEKASELTLEKIQKIVSLLSLEGASIELKQFDVNSFASLDLHEDSESIKSLEALEIGDDEDPLQTTSSNFSALEALEPIADLSFTSLRHFSQSGSNRFIEAPSKLQTTGSFPSGKEIGDLIHKLFDGIFSKGLFTAIKKEEREQFIKGFLMRTPLSAHLDMLLERIEWWLRIPLFNGKAIAELAIHQIQSEMNFIFTVSQNQSAGDLTKTLRGSIDLCVQDQGRIWILDWKTHFLPRDTSREDLREFLVDEGYLLQAKIYALGLQQWLGLFKAPLQLEAVLFCFLHCDEKLEVTTETIQQTDIAEEIFLIDAEKRGAFYE